MPPLQWFPFYPSDFLGGTIRLSFAERSAYALMLVAYYASEEPLPLDKTELYRTVGCESDADRRAVDRVLARKFVEMVDGYHHERCDEVIAKQRASHAKRVHAGRAGGIAKASNALAMPEQCSSNGGSNQNQNQNQNQSLSIAIEREKKRAPRGTRLPPEWTPGDEGLAFCRKERPDLDPQRTFQAFRDYWLAAPGQKGVKADWLATWRNWVRGEKTKPTGATTNVRFDPFKANADFIRSAGGGGGSFDAPGDVWEQLPSPVSE